MNKTLIVLALVLGIISHISADERTINEKITINIPDGLSEMTDEEIVFKYPRNPRPQYGFSTEGHGVSIVITLQPSQLQPNQLNELKDVYEQTLPRMIPNLEWIKREIKTINGREFIMFEMTSSAIDTDIHNIMLITLFEGKMLGFNFNATKSLFKKYEYKLRKAMESIRLKSS